MFFLHFFSYLICALLPTGEVFSAAAATAAFRFLCGVFLGPEVVAAALLFLEDLGMMISSWTLSSSLPSSVSSSSSASSSSSCPRPRRCWRTPSKGASFLLPCHCRCRQRPSAVGCSSCADSCVKVAPGRSEHLVDAALVQPHLPGHVPDLGHRAVLALRGLHGLSRLCGGSLARVICPEGQGPREGVRHGDDA